MHTKINLMTSEKLCGFFLIKQIKFIQKLLNPCDFSISANYVLHSDDFIKLGKRLLIRKRCQQLTEIKAEMKEFCFVCGKMIRLCRKADDIVLCLVHLSLWLPLLESKIKTSN